MKLKTVSDANRRTVMVYVRVTTAEKHKLTALALSAGLTLSDWIRTTTIDSKPLVQKVRPGEETLLKLLWHLSKCGTNLNMVTRQLNRKQEDNEFKVPIADIEMLVAELKQIAATIRSTLV